MCLFSYSHDRLLLNLLPSFALFLIMIRVPRSLGNNSWFPNCNTSFSCGEISGVTFPFWGGDRPYGCGYPNLELVCEGSSTFISIAGVKYLVLRVDSENQLLKIARQDFMNGICLTKFRNTILDPNLFDLVPGYTNFSFMYGCLSVYTPLAGNFTCSGNGTDPDGYVVEGVDWPSSCSKSIVVPVSDANVTAMSGSLVDVQSKLQEGFEVKLKVDDEGCRECIQSNGDCGYDPILNGTTCFCQGQFSGSKSCASSSTAFPVDPNGQPPPPLPPTPKREKKGKKPLVIGFAVGGAGVAGILLGFWLFFLLWRKKAKRSSFPAKMTDLPPTPSSKRLLVSAGSFSRTTPSVPPSKSDLGNESTYFGVRVFSYVELEEATYNFDPSRELGDGGFGTVYYGKLRDGRAVAVKRLYKHNIKRVEQFMNEVEILMRLQHPNLVRLYGCTSKRSQELLLVYEYIPNGTLSDHLIGKNRTGSSPLPWSKRLDIAIETADALAYLHESDVIHRDVKTNNILLDSNFHVKVADFGLSRLFPADVSHVSTAPLGTPGYVDPEYYQCYRLTDKSDVYSFGVLLCELISSKPAVDTNRNRYDINLASMALNRIQSQALNELVDPNLGFDTDYSVRKTMTLVAELAFRCLQEDRDMRPTMGEVLESLKVIGNERGVSREKAEVVREVMDGLRGFGVEKEMMRSRRKPEVIDIRSDDVGLLMIVPPQLPADSGEWAGSSPTHISV